MAAGVPRRASMWFSALVSALLVMSVCSVPAPKLFSRVHRKGVYANLNGLPGNKKSSSENHGHKTETMFEPPQLKSLGSSFRPLEGARNDVEIGAKWPPSLQRQESLNFKTIFNEPQSTRASQYLNNLNFFSNINSTRSQEQPSPDFLTSNRKKHLINILGNWKFNESPRGTLNPTCGQILRNELCPSGETVTETCRNCTIHDFVRRFCGPALEPAASEPQDSVGFATRYSDHCSKYYGEIPGKKEELLSQLSRKPYCKRSIETICPTLKPNRGSGLRESGETCLKSTASSSSSLHLGNLETSRHQTLRIFLPILILLANYGLRTCYVETFFCDDCNSGPRAWEKRKSWSRPHHAVTNAGRKQAKTNQAESAAPPPLEASEEITSESSAEVQASPE